MDNKEKSIRIACKGADTKELDELLAFQGKIKKLTKEKEIKLRKSILKHGFSHSISIWKHNKKNNILDGHQRRKVLKMFRDEGYFIPPIPVDYVYAETEKEAKEKLLAIASQYGEFELDELDLFIEDLDCDIDTINLVGADYEIDVEEEKETMEETGDDSEKIKKLIKKHEKVTYIVIGKYIQAIKKTNNYFSKIFNFMPDISKNDEILKGVINLIENYQKK